MRQPLPFPPLAPGLSRLVSMVLSFSLAAEPPTSLPLLAISGRGQDVWLGRLIPNAAYFRQQLGHGHARQGLKQRWYLGRHLGEVPGDFVHSRSVAVAGRDH